MKQTIFFIAGGGTSGHINPALAIADEIMKDIADAKIYYFGTAKGLEAEMLKRTDYTFVPIRASAFPKRLNLRFWKALQDFLAGRKVCRQLIQKYKPKAIIGTGGYVCGPLVSAANQENVPVLLHEQNAFPGRANRWLARKSQKICVSFLESVQYFKTKGDVVICGNPVRSAFFEVDQESARKELGIAKDKKMLLILGGSLGASRINQAVVELVKRSDWLQLQDELNIEMILVSGERNYEAVKAELPEQKNLILKKYIHNMWLWMAASNLIISRAGAMACAEITALGKASILIPYPYAAGDHQTKNATVLVRAGAALLQRDDAVDALWLEKEIKEMFSQQDKLEAMGSKAKALAQPDAAVKIIQELRKLMK